MAQRRRLWRWRSGQLVKIPATPTPRPPRRRKPEAQPQGPCPPVPPYSLAPYLAHVLPVHGLCTPPSSLMALTCMQGQQPSTVHDLGAWAEACP